VADRLHLRGVVRHSQVLAELPGHDLLLAPSEYETFHLAVVEAVAAGVPVIVTRSGGPQEALAGVEDLVGRFVDVEESPDQLVDAYRELSGALDTLDPDTARAELDSRYGPDAIAGRLAAAYGVPADAARSRPVLVPAEPEEPERVVLLASSAWRRYSVKQEIEACRELMVPTVVVTADPEVTGWAKGLSVVGPGGVDVAPPEPLAVTARRAAGRWKRRLQGRPVVAPSRGARLRPDDLLDATVLVTDCQSMPIAERMIQAHPKLRLALDLDRGGRLGPPPDAGDE